MALQKIVGNNISPTTAALIRSLRFNSPSSYIGLPVGTTAQRPTGISYGTIRFNTTKDLAEIYNTQTGTPDWNTIGSETGVDGGDAFIRTNGTTINKNVTLGPTANNDQKYTHGFLIGDITIDSGITVTIETGSQLIVIDEQPIPFIPVVFDDTLRTSAFLWLDATTNSPGSTWSDTSGNSRNFNVNASSFISGAKYYDFNGDYGCAKNSSDLTLTGDVTIIAVTRPRRTNTNWRTLIRSYVSDHQVMIESGGYSIGIYDNDAAGFISTGISQQTLPSFTTNTFDIMVWRYTNSDNPTYDLNVNGTPFGTITNSNARFNRGFGSIGAYHNGNTDPISASQYWGDIRLFAAYNKRLTNAQVLQYATSLEEQGYRNQVFGQTTFVPGDSGNGKGFSASQGANTSNVTGYTNTSMLQYNSSWILSAGGNGLPLNYTCSGSSSNFAFHTGHSGNSSQWPMYFAVRVTLESTGKVLNSIDWYKHSNACGNVDFFGSNLDINSSNYNVESNYTYLGRAHTGGSGSASDCNVISRTFNLNNYGYRWYMMKIVDNNSSALSYPSVGSLGGWAMYGLRLNKI